MPDTPLTVAEAHPDLFDERGAVNADSQEGAILAWLQGGNTLTATEALARFGCGRLAARIAGLRGKGYRIESPLVEVETRNGMARVANYRMVG